MVFNDTIKIDVYEPLARSRAVLASGDNMANCFGASIYQDGKAVDISGHAVTGYYITPNGDTLVIAGSASGNTAQVTLPQACYTAGNGSLAIKVSGTAFTATVRVVDCYTRTVKTGNAYDPGNAVPALDDILAQIAAMEQATAQTQTATANAQQATEEAQAATQEMMTTSAPAIIPTATGEVVTITDSADRPLAGLRLYGKTTQDGVPTPAASVPLVNVGADGNIGVHARGKNLLHNKATSQTVNGVTFTVNADKSIKVSGTATTEALFHLTDYLTDNIYNGMVVTGGFDTYLSFAINYFTIDKGWRDVTICRADNTVLPDKDYPLTRSAIRVAAGATVDRTIYPMLRIATIADTSYEPYKDGGSLTASTPNGLPGIPVTSGGNYTDASGQQWICDEVDFGRGVYVQRVNTLTFGANTALALYGSNGGVSVVAKGINTNSMLCNITKHASRSALWSGTGYGIADNFDYNQIALRLEGYTTVDEYKALLTALEASGDPVTVLHAITPVETALTDDEIAAYRAMTSHKPNTTVYNDAGAGLAVDYIADTQTYIDQRISALLNA